MLGLFSHLQAGITMVSVVVIAACLLVQTVKTL